MVSGTTQSKSMGLTEKSFDNSYDTEGEFRLPLNLHYALSVAIHPAG